MLAALALGVPVGGLAAGLYMAWRHPTATALLAEHPLLALPAAGIGVAAGVIWTAAGVLGAGMPAAALRDWVVVAAACLYLWFDCRHARATSESRR